MNDKNAEPAFNVIKKNWIAIVGAFFFLMGILYLLKVLFEEVEIPPWLKLSFGVFAGLTAMAGGLKLHSLTHKIVGETMAGFGLATVYGSLAWGVIGGILNLPEIALLMLLCGFSVLVIVLSSQLNMRILSLLGLIGGLWSGFLTEHKASNSSIIPLTIYLISLNTTGVVMSVRQAWPEFRIVPFFISILTILVAHTPNYLGKYSHTQAEAWLFLLSFSGLYWYAFYYHELNSISTKAFKHYLNAMNMLFLLTGSVLLAKWAGIASAWPMTGVSILLFVSGLQLRARAGGNHSPIYFILASLLFTLSAFSYNILADTPGMHHAVRSAVWGILVFVLLLTGIRLKSHAFVMSGFGIFLYSLIYWYGTAWSVAWFPILGFPYLPFVNPGGLVWILFTISAFVFAGHFRSLPQNESLGGLGLSPKFLQFLSLFLGHLIIMGLLTIQISNVWSAYHFESSRIKVTWVHSLIWTGYSLVLFFTASRTHEKFFSTVASILLLGTSLKVIFHDLQGQTNLIRAIFLLLIGAMMMGIAWALQKRLREK